MISSLKTEMNEISNNVIIIINVIFIYYAVKLSVCTVSESNTGRIA